jgi:hypothetical protein
VDGSLLLVAFVLAAYRLSRLVTTDRLTMAPRHALIARSKAKGDDDPLLAALITCDWCVSVYTSAFVVGLSWLFIDPGLSLPFLWWAATAGGAGILASVVDRVEGLD